MKALPLDIYKHNHQSCSNHGISERFNDVLLICDEGFIEIDMENPPENLVKLVVRELWGKEYKHLEPVKPKNKGCVGYMFGGSYVASCDGRFRDISKYPLPLHDRQESQELSDILSR